MNWKGKATLREKGHRDLVTEADLASQQEIRRIIHANFPDHDFLGEEEDTSIVSPAGGRHEYRWIVDPLDGTMNYVHQLRSFAVSIALEERGRIVTGVVYDPELDELYHAELGYGAFLNDTPIQTSGCQAAENALVAVSLPPNVPRGSVEIARMIETIHACQGVRRLGSAALNLCYVAQGSLDAYWATSVKIWDIAAGMLILREAGGAVASLAEGPVDWDRPQFAAAATLSLQRELCEILTRARSEAE
jgi:myo-inositol-1(or 4)-monophosphatase